MAKVTNPSPTFPRYPGGALAVTTSDTVPLTYPSIIYVGVGGNVRVLTAQGDDVTFVGVQAGGVVPVQVLKVFATSTTATSLVAIY
jgi:hypothetical protein